MMGALRVPVCCVCATQVQTLVTKFIDESEIKASTACAQLWHAAAAVTPRV